MLTFFWIILTIVIFFLIVLVHEFGHFIAARIFWVRVEEFWIGIPPKAKELFTDKKWTLYTLNWLPIWWFVRLKGESFDEKELSEKDSLVSKPAWQQIIIMLSWIFMNLVLAFLIFTILFMVGIKPIWINSKFETNVQSKLIPTYNQAIEKWFLEKKINFVPIEWKPAQIAWMRSWDVLIAINNNKFEKSEEVIKYIKKTQDILKMKLLREWKEIEIQVIPKNNLIWAYVLDTMPNMNYKVKYWFFESFAHWLDETKNQVILGYEALGWIFKSILFSHNKAEQKEAIDNLGWPVAAWDMFVWLVKSWVSFDVFVIIAALISVNLWFFNLIPFPALDWWRALFLMINEISVRTLKKKFFEWKIENIIHIVWFAFLITLSIIILFKDILKIIFRS